MGEGSGLPSLGRFKCHPGLEGRVVRLPHTRKHTIPPFEIWQAQNPFIPPVQFLGSSSEVFNLEAMREREIRKIRVVLDEINQDDEQMVKRLRLSVICAK